MEFYEDFLQAGIAAFSEDITDEDDEYYFDSLKMEKDVWDMLTNKYLSVENDEIQSIVLYDGTKDNYSH